MNLIAAENLIWCVSAGLIFSAEKVVLLVKPDNWIFLYVLNNKELCRVSYPREFMRYMILLKQKKENIGKGLSYSEIILESLFKKSLAIRKIKSLRFWRLFCSYLGNY